MPKSFLFVLVLLLTVYDSSAQCRIKKKIKPGLQVADSVKLAAVPDALPFKIPPGLPGSSGEMDLKDLMPPVGDQGVLNSCGAWALGYACRSYFNLQTDEEFRKLRKPNYAKIISPNFIFNMLNQGNNEPISMLAALQLMTDTGACSWRAWKLWKPWPISLSPYKQKPGARQMAEAHQFKIASFGRINPNNLVEDVKSEIRSGIPVIIEAEYDPDFLRLGFFHLLERKRSQQVPYVWDSTNFKPSAANTGPQLCHAMVITGYSDSLQAFKIMNSYGKQWGNMGFCWLSYQIAKKAIPVAYVIAPNRNNKPVIATDSMAPETKVSGKHCCRLKRGCCCKKKPKPAIPDTTSSSKEAINPAEEVHASNQFAVKMDLVNQAFVDSYAIGVSVKVTDCQCDSFQLVIRFFYADPTDSSKAGLPMLALDPAYRLSNGQAFIACEKQNFSGEISLQEVVRMPLNRLVLNTGTNRLVAEAVLFNDEYPVMPLGTLAFTVNR